MPDFARLYLNRMRSFKPLTRETVSGQFACSVYGRLAGLDTEFVAEEGIIRTLTASLPYNLRPSRFIPMPYTMVEVFGAKEGEFHDIRPQAFSTAPFQAALTNLAIRTMPFGIALRGSNAIRELNQFEYRGSLLDVSYSGSGALGAIELNAAPLQYTLQIPDQRLKPGNNRVAIQLQPTPSPGPTLVYSTVRLLDVEDAGAAIRYKLMGFCQNVLIFRGVPGVVAVSDSNGRPVETKQTRDGNHLFVEFAGKDGYTAEFAK
jgi:hypothetical protein